METQKKAQKLRRGLSIMGKLVLAVTICIVLVMALFIWVIYDEMSTILIDENEALLEASTQTVVQEASGWVSSVLTSLEIQRDTIEYQNLASDENALMQYIHHTVNGNDAYPAGVYVALVDGPLLHATFQPGPDYDMTTKAWYQNGLSANDIIFGDVYLDGDSNSYVVGSSGSLHGPDGNVIGVLAADVYLNSISNIVNDVRIQETGGVFLVDTRTNTIIGAPDAQVVGQTLDAVADQTLYATATSQLQSGVRGADILNGFYLNIADIPGSDWVAVAYVDQTEVLASVRHLLLAMLVMGTIAVVALIVLLVIMVARIIGHPVKELTTAATKIANGDLDAKVAYHSRDELGVLAEDFRQVTDRLSDYQMYINEIAEKLNDIANGDLTYTLKNDYAGEFARIKTSLDRISKELNGTMGQLKNASRDVAAGALQVSNEATSLSQGSTQQASEVDSIARHINSVSENVQNVSRGTSTAQGLAREVRTGLLDSQSKMEGMSQVISSISSQSNEIHQIVKTIEDIAFQTNILALNAAVEAARAGSSGAGFAVVADEVRTLARRSSEAAQETSELLSQTVDSMGDSVNAAQSLSVALSAVVEKAEKMDQLLTQIANYSKTQSQNTSEIAHGISEISSVCQHNVAAVEASAAASEELSGQAHILEQMVNQFKVKEA